MDAKLAIFKAQCRQAGYKITPQRLAVYRVLAQSNEHPSAESVYRDVKKVIPEISLDTVNRTLVMISEIGAAFVVEGSGESRRFDGNTGNHQHIKCLKCKRIVDFHHEPFDNIEVPEVLNKEFKVLRKTVYFEGVCNSCMEVDERN